MLCPLALATKQELANYQIASHRDVVRASLHCKSHAWLQHPITEAGDKETHLSLKALQLCGHQWILPLSTTCQVQKVFGVLGDGIFISKLDSWGNAIENGSVIDQTQQVWETLGLFLVPGNY